MVLAAVLAAVLIGSSAHATPADSFVQRSGPHLTLAGKPYRFGGANIEWLGLAGYGPADPTGPHYPTHFEVDDALSTAKEMGANVVRVQTMGDSVGCSLCVEPTLGHFNQRAFAHIDYALAAARERGIKVIPTIIGDDAQRGGSGCVYLRWRGINVPNCSLINMGPFWTDARVITDVKAHIAALLNHVNVYTHVAYKNDPTILGWDLLNGGGSPTPWTRQIASYARSVDKNHLILSGAANAALPDVDACVMFVYPHWNQSLASRLNEVAACKRAGKPFLVYEYGWDRTNFPTQPELREFLAGLEHGGIYAGSAFWALQAHARGHGWLPIPADTSDPETAEQGESGEWWALYYPRGIDTIVNTAADMAARAQIIRAHNYAMRGLPLPPHLIPPRPRITSVAPMHIYWEGSAGAGSYSVQRASKQRGPWRTMCTRCTDDGFAGPTASGWYRVIAYNLDGRPSRPSTPARAKVGAAKKPAIAFLQEPKRKRLRIVAPGYELALSNRSGSILSLLAGRTKTHVLLGENGCLWAAREDGVSDYIGGCSYTPTGANRFSYSWNKTTTTLTLRYGSDAVVTLAAQRTSFSLQVTLANRTQHPLWSVVFPADLYGPSGAVTAGYAPNFLPGVRLGPGFFTGTHENVLTYPGRWGFADFLALDFETGANFAMYSVNPPPNPIHPIELGFVHNAPSGGCAGRVFCMTHSFNTWVAQGATWTSPVVRVRLGDPVERTLAAYRDDNGISSYPSVADKLGAKFPAYAQAPLIKADARKGLPPLSQWASDLKKLPSPALLHPVRFQPGAFDATDPDFLPPDPTVGTTADLRAMVDAAHALGISVMPYLNITWWNVNSPTVRELLQHGSASDFAALDAAKQPDVEPYHDFTGYVVSPHAPAVRDRLAQMMREWHSDVPVDCTFFDQIGARAWVRDFNPFAPDPLSYGDGWVSLMAPYANDCLMVEDGWDRLAQSFSAFHGGLLVVQRETQDQDYLYGAGNWQPFPLAPYLLHDKVLFYQHDLSELTMTRDLPTLSWNLAFGYMLSYPWEVWPGYDSLADPWLDAVGAYQRTLGPLYAGQPLQSYTYVTPTVTRTTFPNLSVVTNWSGNATYATDGYTIAPSGFLARSNDGGVVSAAVNGAFDGFTLSPGTHQLIVAHSGATITVHQPIGADTDVGIPIGNGNATVRDEDGVVPSTIQNGRLVFTCRGPGVGAHAPTYTITAG